MQNKNFSSPQCKYTQALPTNRKQSWRRIRIFASNAMFLTLLFAVCLCPSIWAQNSYVFHLQKFHIDNTRSVHEDTDIVSFGVSLKPIRRIAIGPKTLRRAEQQIESCEYCHPDDVEIPFDWLLAEVTGNRGPYDDRVQFVDGDTFHFRRSTF